MARIITFYLPQFHPIPENDAWWGKGFTEWTNVAKAKPLFRGHYQPHVPADLGFYDLRLGESRIAQANLARHYGIEGFCYWHYWFGHGKRILERPFNEVYESGEPDFPFCLAWANETWTGIWHGASDNILLEQKYPGMDDHGEHIDYLLNVFSDQRYIQIDGCPLLLVYRPTELPDSKRVTDFWRDKAVKRGFKGLHIVGITNNGQVCDYKNLGYDAITVSNINLKCLFNFNNEPFAKLKHKLLDRSLIEKLFKKVLNRPTNIYEYRKAIKYFICDGIEDYYPTILPNWDNTPRSGVNGIVFKNSEPEIFRESVIAAIDKVSGLPEEKRLIFVKSWNEWAEGNHLEPDIKFGTGYLQVIKEELDKLDRKNH